MKVAANIKYLKISAQKLRAGADLVRGQRAIDAQARIGLRGIILRFVAEIGSPRGSLCCLQGGADTF